MAMSREEATEFARQLCSTAATRNREAEVVVLVTDEEGAWVGCAATVGQRRTADILRSAAHGADRRTHSNVVDMEAD